MILGIETSCDDTSVALYGAKGLIGNWQLSSMAIHSHYGGVIPEIASREHAEVILPLIAEALQSSNIEVRALKAIAYTKGPGLVGALLIGATAAKTLGYALNIPTIGINHLEGHLLAIFLEHQLSFPFLTLLISGGHSELILAEQLGEYKIIGHTLDDAAGEAFDKTAKLLGLPYPGGPALEQLASQGQATYKLPIALKNKNNLNFSFSGLKTKMATLIKETTPAQYADLAASFQETMANTLYYKCKLALSNYPNLPLVVAGGVGANLKIRSTLQTLAPIYSPQILFPSPQFCTDNAAMIALSGYYRLQQGLIDQDNIIRVKARWSLDNLNI